MAKTDELRIRTDSGEIFRALTGGDGRVVLVPDRPTVPQAAPQTPPKPVADPDKDEIPAGTFRTGR